MVRKQQLPTHTVLASTAQVFYCNAQLSFDRKCSVIFSCTQGPPLATTGYAKNALVTLPGLKPREGQWDSQKSLALHFLLVKVLGEKTVPIQRYDRFFRHYAN